MIGGGPAGAAAATTLARTGRSVLLFDDSVAGVSWRIGEGAPPGLDRAVDDVFGFGTFVAADHVPSYANRSAWGSDRTVDTEFMFNPFGAGWHLDRVAFDTRLLEIASAAGVTVRTETVDGNWIAETPFVVDASGRRAVFARRHGARLVNEDRLIAAVAVFPRSAEDEDTTTTVEAVESGWWYTSAIPGSRRVVALLTDGDLLPSGIRRADRFAELVATTHHVASLVDGQPEPPRLVAAGSGYLDRPSGDGWVAVGDAAACFDPLSSQGLLTAVLMGGVVAEGITDPDGYVARYRAIVDHYRTERLAVYALEQRWPDSPFWSRRHRP